MKLGYTEFSYGYAFTENLIRASAHAPLGAPVFPNLIQEAQLGFDVQINLPAAPIFFQYKLPELMTRGTAKELATYGLHDLGLPFFRMPLMRRDLSNQHRLLVELEQSTHGRVFYASTHLRNAHDFSSAYNAALVHRSSALFSPGAIGLLRDDRTHSVAYSENLAHGWFCSEPREIKALTFNKMENLVAGDLREPGRSLPKVAREVHDEVLDLVPPRLRQMEGLIRQRVRTRASTADGASIVTPETREVVEELLVTRELARVGLGVDMVLAQPSP